MIIFHVLNVVGDALVRQFVGNVRFNHFKTFNVVYCLLWVFLLEKLGYVNCLFVYFGCGLVKFLEGLLDLFMRFGECWALRDCEVWFRSEGACGF